MLDSLFKSNSSSKFYRKCKSAIECTRTQLDERRQKKQAMAKFFKKDVAYLLANGHESLALARTEKLIVEMNLVRCYDMIEQGCNYIMKQLENMEKESECPKEALEAVSTLIFAAARFSGLPELRDLRDILTERYGSSFEHFVNPGFVQNSENKSFTDKEKLRVMKRVAEELSVPFDSTALETEINSGQQRSRRNVSPTSGTEDGENGECGGWFRQTSATMVYKRLMHCIKKGLDGDPDPRSRRLEMISLLIELENRRKKKGQLQPSESEA